MALTFAGNLDRSLLLGAVETFAPLVTSDRVTFRWNEESSLPGLTIGGLVRHLVSQPECAVEFLGIDGPDWAPLSLPAYFGRVDWLYAAVNAVENTSIRDDFNEMAGAGPDDSVAVLDRARADLPGAVAAAGPTTYVPWQDCSLPTDDFLVVRLMEIVVHTDDLATSLGLPTPTFDEDVLDPVLALLSVLSVRRNGQDGVLRALSRNERGGAPVAAF